MDDTGSPIRSSEPSIIGGYPDYIRNMTSGKHSEMHGGKVAVEMEDDEPQSQLEALSLIGLGLANSGS